MVAELGLDSDSVMAALLHDTIEDTDATHEEVAKRFSPTVADLVEGVTKLTKMNFASTDYTYIYSCARCSWPWPRTCG